MDCKRTLAVPFWFLMLVSVVVAFPYELAIERGWIPESALFLWTLAAVIVLVSELGWRAYANRDT
jgi:hypothetical protein